MSVGVSQTERTPADPGRAACFGCARAWLIAASLLLCASCSKKSDCSEPSAGVKTAGSARQSGEVFSATPVAPPAGPPGSLRFVAIGGGPTPESTEVSLEQDIQLVTSTLPKPGTVMFAGGKGSLAVREMDPDRKSVV